MRTIAFVQARMASSRLPGKALLPLAGEPMLYRVVQRVRSIPCLDDVVVVTGADRSNDPIRSLCKARAVTCFSGHDTDVLERFRDALFTYSATSVLRITADCPLVDPALITTLMLQFEASMAHYGVIVTGASDDRYVRYPDGLDAELMTGYALCYAHSVTMTDREHVTRRLWQEPRPLRTHILSAPVDYGHIRLTVDTPEDYARVQRIYDALYSPSTYISLDDVLAHPELYA